MRTHWKIFKAEAQYFALLVMFSASCGKSFPKIFGVQENKSIHDSEKSNVPPSKQNFLASTAESEAVDGAPLRESTHQPSPISSKVHSTDACSLASKFEHCVECCSDFFILESSIQNCMNDCQRRDTVKNER